ncbi:MAG: hypothetical protein HYX46_13155 [Betaproteobacteria bacterium]|nr:hypothetical protein [Betaproteobacteria bacterium]
MSVNGQTAVNGVITLETSTYKLVMDAATGGYTFTLKSNLLVSGEGENVAALLQDGFSIVAQDGDGDPIAAPITLNVNVVDDVPVVTAGSDTIQVDEDDLPAGTDESKESLTVSGTIQDNANWGADGFGGVVSVNGQTAVDGVITLETSTYKLVMNAATGGYDFTLKSNLLVAGEGENLAALLQNGFSIVAQDGDGDPVAAPITLNVNVVDDVPVLVSATDTLNAVEDDNLAGGNNETDPPTASASGNLADNINWGADGFGKLVSVNGVEADEGGTITVIASDGSWKLEVQAASGDYTFTLLKPATHSDPSTENEFVTLSNSFAVVGEDKDGDAIDTNVTVKVDVYDDAPVMKSEFTPITAAVDEDALTGQSTGNADDSRPGETAGTNSAVASGAAGALNALVSVGADGPASFSLKTQTPIDSGLDSKGASVMIVSDGTTLHGYVNNGGGAGFDEGDREVFTLTVGSDGSYTFTLKDQIDHPSLNDANGDNTENLLATPLDLSGYVVATDADGDKLTLAAGAFTVQVLDDIPVVILTEGALQNDTGH